MSVAAAYAARVAVDAAAATVAEEVEGGVRLATPELPTIWDLNQLLLAPGADAARLERLLYELDETTQRITLFDPVEPVGAARGWSLTRSLLMVAGPAAAAWPDGVQVVAPETVRPAQVQAWRDEGLGETAMLEAMLERFAAFPGYTVVAAHEGAELAAWAAVANGCIDDVWVQPGFRGRGLGRAVTRAAQAAGGWFLWTEAADPVPQQLYRSLGMRVTGAVLQLTRDPG